MKKYWGILELFFVVTIFFLFPQNACSEDIKVGVIFSLSGPHAQPGNECLQGVELAAEVQNERGGIGGNKIRLVVADAPDPKAGAGEAERLTTIEKTKIILGTLSSPLSMASSEVTNRYQVPHFELSATSDSITERGYKYFWRICCRASDFARMVVDFTKEVTASKLGMAPEKLRIAIAAEDSIYGGTILNFLDELMPPAKLTNIVAKERYSARAVDLSPLIMKIKAAKPDVLLAASYTNDGILMLRQAKELGLNVKAWHGFGAGYGDAVFGKALGKDSDYILNVGYCPPNYVNKNALPGLEDLVNRYQKKYGQPLLSVYPAATYMGAMVVFDIIRRAGSLDAEAIAKAAWETDISEWSTPSGWGVKFFGPGKPHPGQNARSFAYILQWKDVKYQVIWPAKANYAEPALPMPSWNNRGK
jgi:branched-chain amino acid transport system substrate-binding protein